MSVRSITSEAPRIWDGAFPQRDIETVVRRKDVDIVLEDVAHPLPRAARYERGIRRCNLWRAGFAPGWNPGIPWRRGRGTEENSRGVDGAGRVNDGGQRTGKCLVIYIGG